MSVYLELHVKGGNVALIEARMIGGVACHGTDAWAVGTAASPTTVIMRAGESFEVIGVSAAGLIGRVVLAKEAAAQHRISTGSDVYVDWLTPLKPDDADAA